MSSFTLLYVEDDTDILQDIVFLLKDYFSEIYTAQDGEEAISKYATHKPDIVLLDINIPKKNGLEVARIIREEDQETPILFLTAYSDRGKLLDAINLGVSAYLVKPFKVDELKDAIKKIIVKREPKSHIELGNGFLWNHDTNKLLYKSNELTLTKKEAELINILNNNKQKFLSACEIASEISLQNIKDPKCNNAVQLLSRFKNKVLNSFETEQFFILNVYGMGYKLS